MKKLRDVFERIGFAPCVVAYFAVLFVIRGIVFRGAAMDEADELLFAQTFQRGYMFRNPPFFTWLLVALEKITPPSDSMPVLIRFAALATAYICLHRAALRFFDQRLALVAALSPVALYLIGWRMITTYTHSALLLAACAATLLSFLRLVEQPSAVRYGILGVVMGLGMLAKYNYPLFAIALFVAASARPEMRRAIVAPRFVLSVVIALAMFSPHAAWLVAHRDETSYVAQHRLGTAASWSDFGKRFYAIFAVGRSILEFIVPFVLMLPFVVRRDLPREAGQRSDTRWIGVSIALQLAIFVAAVFVTGAVQIRVHHMLTMFLFPLVIFGASRTRVHERRTLVILTTVALLILPLAFIDLARATTRRSEMLRQVDYSALAATFEKEGVSRGEVVSIERQYAFSGSIRPFLPAARVRSTKWPEFISSRAGTAPTVVFFWRRGELDPAFAAPLQRYLDQHPSLTVTSVDVPLQHGSQAAFSYIAIRPVSSEEKGSAEALMHDVLSQTSKERGWRNG